MITWSTNVNAPCCPGEIVNDDGRAILIQTDWDYPSTASTFGWSTRAVQRCRECGGVAIGISVPLCPDCDHALEEHEICDHGTDGTVDCHQCGLTTGDFINAAYDWLVDHDGATADDPGYFSER